jgi:hypothetical protein
MNGIFRWLVTLVVIAMLAPFFICLIGQLFVTAAVALLPWVIGLAALVGLTAGLGAGLALRKRLPPPMNDRFPPGEVPRIRRPRGVRTER